MSHAASSSSSSSTTPAPILAEIKEKESKVKDHAVLLARNTNQALGIAQFAIDFLDGKLGSGPDASVLNRVELFHTDSVVCGLSALALGTNAPTVLREEALDYPNTHGANVFGNKKKVHPEKAVVANSSAVREWDSNGTVFGYNEKLGKAHMQGEFGHNDFYPVVIAAAQQKQIEGEKVLKAFILIDEIRGRLAEVFSLKTFKIDHVVHGAIASAAVYGALLGATVKQIESAIGMVVAHYIPWRAIRAGEQLSDSKGASAAVSAEVAVLSVHRALRGFIGPADIFRNPEAVFRYFMPTTKSADGDAPFDLALSHSGTDFAVMGMHFKMGLYEHQSAGALHGLLALLSKHPQLASDKIQGIKIVAYQPAFGIIGDPHKRNPETRQSADHSMVYIVSSMLRKAITIGAANLKADNLNELWKQLMLLPIDYSRSALHDATTRKLMNLIEFAHGGKEYDDKYPDGIPTSIVITGEDGKEYDSGFIMYPAGHARNTNNDLEAILKHKFHQLASLAVSDAEALLEKLSNLKEKSAAEIGKLYGDIEIVFKKRKRDESPSRSKSSRKKSRTDEEEAKKDDAMDEEY